MLETAVITDTLTVFAQCIRNLLFSSFKITGTKRFFLECIRNRLLKHTRKEAVKNHMTTSLVCYKKTQSCSRICFRVLQPKTAHFTLAGI